MPTYNVLAAVVELIDASTEAEAKTQLEQRLTKDGYSIYTDLPTDAFESE